MHIWVLFSWARWARWHLLSPVAGAEVRAPRAGPWCPYLPSLIVFPAIVGLGRMSGPGLSPEGLPAGKVWVCWGHLLGSTWTPQNCVCQAGAFPVWQQS